MPSEGRQILSLLRMPVSPLSLRAEHHCNPAHPRSRSVAAIQYNASCATNGRMKLRNILVISLSFCVAAGAQTVWPTKAWPEATPESQGLDSKALTRVLDQAPAGLHSLLVIRHGHVVLDSYFYPFASGMVHDAASVSKTIT